MTRIIAGSLAGRRLAVPGRIARPTTDRVREAVFSSIEHRLGGLVGCRVLDLYSGSGALALEALSRGAADATAVERDRAALGVLRRNIESLGVGDRATAIGADAQRWLPTAGPPFQLVLLDPPYDVAARTVAALLAKLADAGCLAPGALIVVERPARDAESPLPATWVAQDRRRYGETAVWYGHAQDDDPDLEGA